MVFAYLLGVSARGAWARWNQGRPAKSFRRWEDVKAIVVLTVLLYTAAAHLLDRADLAPHHLLNATLGLDLFYFGSR